MHLIVSITLARVRCFSSSAHAGCPHYSLHQEVSTLIMWLLSGKEGTYILEQNLILRHARRACHPLTYAARCQRVYLQGGMGHVGGKSGEGKYMLWRFEDHYELIYKLSSKSSRNS